MSCRRTMLSCWIWGVFDAGHIYEGDLHVERRADGLRSGVRGVVSVVEGTALITGYADRYSGWQFC